MYNRGGIVSRIAQEIIERHQLKELFADTEYKRGWHRGYWEGIKDCMDIECKERTLVRLNKGGI